MQYIYLDTGVLSLYGSADGINWDQIPGSSPYTLAENTHYKLIANPPSGEIFAKWIVTNNISNYIDLSDYYTSETTFITPAWGDLIESQTIIITPTYVEEDNKYLNKRGTKDIVDRLAKVEPMTQNNTKNKTFYTHHEWVEDAEDPMLHQRLEALTANNWALLRNIRRNPEEQDLMSMIEEQGISINNRNALSTFFLRWLESADAEDMSIIFNGANPPEGRVTVFENPNDDVAMKWPNSDTNFSLNWLYKKDEWNGGYITIFPYGYLAQVHLEEDTERGDFKVVVGECWQAPLADSVFLHHNDYDYHFALQTDLTKYLLEENIDDYLPTETNVINSNTTYELPTASAVKNYIASQGYVTTDTDTKNTAGATDTSSRIYLIGATTQESNPQTYSDNEIFGKDGVLNAQELTIGSRRIGSTIGNNSSTFGYFPIASGDYSHAEGDYTKATGNSSHAEGRDTVSSGDYSHAEGYLSTASGSDAHAEGSNTAASGQYSHTEGYLTMATDKGSHAEGYFTHAKGKHSHAEGGAQSLSEGTITLTGDANATTYTTNDTSKARVGDCVYYSIGTYPNKIGSIITSISTNTSITLDKTLSTSALSNASCKIFKTNLASGEYSHTEGYDTAALGFASHAEGQYYVTASGASSHAEGARTTASGQSSHSEGVCSIASGAGSHAEGETCGIAITLTGDANAVTYTTNNTKNAMVGDRIGWTNEDTVSHPYPKIIAVTSNTSITLDRTLSSSAISEQICYLHKSSRASGYGSHAEGRGTMALKTAAHAEGSITIASGDYSHAEGSETTASGDYTHAEGEVTYAIGQDSHTEGAETYAFGASSHAEGGISANRTAGTFTISSLTREVTVEGKKYTKIGFSAYTFSNYLEALVIFANGSPYAFVNFDENNDELYFSPSMTSSDFNTLSVGDTVPIYYCGNLTLGTSAHAEGLNTAAKGDWSHTEGYSTSALRTAAHAEGHYSIASKDYAHAEGANTTASGMYGSHAEGYFATASGEASHAEGKNTTASGNYSHAGGMLTKASGGNSYAEGYNTIASGEGSHAEGFYSQALGDYSHAEGIGQSSSPSQTTVTVRSHTIPSSDDNDESVINVLASWNFLGGYFKFNNHYFRITNFTRASNEMPYYNCTIKPGFTIAEAQSITDDTTTLEVIYFGQSLLALGECSHAEGSMSQAIGILSHAEGQETIASGSISHTEGTGTIAEGNNQHVQGTFNIVDTTSAHIVGNGTGPNAKSNAHTLDTSGNAWFAGDVYVYSTSGTNKDSGSRRLITEDEVMTLLQQIINTNNLIDPFQE